MKSNFDYYMGLGFFLVIFTLIYIFKPPHTISHCNTKPGTKGFYNYKECRK